MINLFFYINKIFNRKRINLLLTFYVNFKLLPFHQAKRLPIYVYGRWYHNLMGKISINAPIKRGMIKLGIDLAQYVNANKGRISVSKQGQIIFNGEANISQGCSIIVAEKGILSIGKNNIIGDNVKIICYNSVSIGECVALAWESQLTDFAFHYIMQMEDETISNIYKKVQIGNFCWIGNRTTIMPGTVLPDRIIVASNSLLNKNYVAKGIENYSLIGGIPARLISIGVKRIFLKENEKILRDCFLKNKTEKVSSSIIPIKE